MSLAKLCPTHQVPLDCIPDCSHCGGEGIIESDWIDQLGGSGYRTCPFCNGSGDGYPDCELCLQEQDEESAK